MKKFRCTRTTGAATWKERNIFAPSAAADEIAQYFRSLNVVAAQ